MNKLFFLLPFLISCASMNPLSQKYPNILIIPDYGVLTEVDFKVAESNRIKPIPLYNHHNSYKYWQCFPVQDVTLGCHLWSTDDPKKFLADADIRAYSGKEYHEYGGRRADDLKLCQKSLKEWKRISANVDTICLLGEAAGMEQKIRDGKKIVVKGWVWDMVKTKKGCNSYFGEDCYADVP